MPRIRSIKPEFFSHPEVARISIEARLLLISLLTQADDDGRLYDQPRKISGLAFGEDDDVNVPELLEELQAKSRIERYERDDKKCIQILNFDKHQVIAPSKRRPSAIPPPPKRRPRATDEQTDGSEMPADGQHDGSGPDARNREPGTGNLEPNTPPTPRQRGANPRANGTNPRAEGIRQEIAVLHGRIEACAVETCNGSTSFCTACGHRRRQIQDLETKFASVGAIDA